MSATRRKRSSVAPSAVAEALGMAVDIRHQGERGGEVTVAYKTLEQLDEICRRLAHHPG